MKIAVYPGSFDPVTVGHMNILTRAASLFDRVIVGVLSNVHKDLLFSETERLNMINCSISEFNNVQAEVFSGLTVDFCKKVGAKFIVRGTRQHTDVTYELQMAHVNKKLCEEIDTVFFPSNDANFCVSSSLIKELANFGADISELVPNKIVKRCIMEKFRRLKTGR